MASKSVKPSKQNECDRQRDRPRYGEMCRSIGGIASQRTSISVSLCLFIAVYICLSQNSLQNVAGAPADSAITLRAL